MDQSAILDYLSGASLNGIALLQLLVSLFIAILFTQSGLDKVFNWKGNVAYFSGHFKNSPLAKTVPLLMPVITLSEVSAGLLSALGIIVILLSGNPDIAIAGMFVACLSIIQLFFGQRLAQDYEGAAVLVPYFLVTVAGLWLYLAA